MRISQGTIRTLCPKAHPPSAAQTREVLRPDLADGDPNMVVATASGDGFARLRRVGHRARAAETMWWWDPADRADRAVDGGGAPGKTKGVVARARARGVAHRGRVGPGRFRGQGPDAREGSRSLDAGTSSWTAPRRPTFDGSRAPRPTQRSTRSTGTSSTAAATTAPGRSSRCPRRRTPKRAWTAPGSASPGASSSAPSPPPTGPPGPPRRQAQDRVLFHMPTDATHFAYMLAWQRTRRAA